MAIKDVKGREWKLGERVRDASGRLGTILDFDLKGSSAWVRWDEEEKSSGVLLELVEPEPIDLLSKDEVDWLRAWIMTDLGARSRGLVRKLLVERDLLRAALENLGSVQNGPPLLGPKEEAWHEAMQQADFLLREREPPMPVSQEDVDEFVAGVVRANTERGA